MPGGDPIGLCAVAIRVFGEIQQRSNVGYVEAEPSGMADKIEVLDVRRSIVAVIAARAVGLREQADPFIVADRLHVRGRRPRKLSDLQSHATTS